MRRGGQGRYVLPLDSRLPFDTVWRGGYDGAVPARLFFYLALIGAWAVAASSTRAADYIEAFQPSDRLVATYYFNWYIDGKTYKSRNWKLRPDPEKDAAVWTWQPHYPKADEAGSVVFGLNDPSAWPRNKLPDTSKWPDSDDYLYHVAELRSMKWAGLDVVYVDVWWPNDFITKETPAEVEKASGKSKTSKPKAAPTRRKSGTPQRELSALLQAWQYLDKRGERPVKLALNLETPSFQKADMRGASKESDKLFQAIWAFYRVFFGENDFWSMMPCRSLAAIRDKGRTRLMVNLFLPRMQGEPNGEWISRWDVATFENLRARFQGMSGVSLWLSVNQHVHGPKFGGWNGVQADGSAVDISRAGGVVDQDIGWHSTLAGPLVRDDSIAIGAGYFNRGKDARPGGDAKNADGSLAYPRAYRYIREADATSSYEQQWREVLANPENFRRHLVMIECWNELIEGSQISPAKPDVLRDAQGAYLDRWGERPTTYIELTRKYVALWKGVSEEQIERAAKAPAPEEPTSKPARKSSGAKSKKRR